VRRFHENQTETLAGLRLGEHQENPPLPQSNSRTA
jgi:hypothetical protein